MRGFGQTRAGFRAPKRPNPSRSNPPILSWRPRDAKSGVPGRASALRDTPDRVGRPRSLSRSPARSARTVSKGLAPGADA